MADPVQQSSLQSWRMIGQPFVGNVPSPRIRQILGRWGTRVVIGDACWWLEVRR